jgi:hypothetical protein
MSDPQNDPDNTFIESEGLHNMVEQAIASAGMDPAEGDKIWTHYVWSLSFSPDCKTLLLRKLR